MNLVLDFSVCITDNCCSAQFCDTTCEYQESLPANCVDGYGYLDNPTKRDIDHVRFNWQFPDGTAYTNLDLSWKPGTKSFVEWQLTGGTNGIIVVDIAGLVVGSITFVTDIETTMDLLVLSVNGSTGVTGWSAQIKDGTTDTITITQVNYGVEHNNLITTVTLSGDLTASIPFPLTSDGTDETSCFCITPENIMNASSNSTTENCQSFPDGVHPVSYILYNASSEEIARKTKKFLFLCNLTNGIQDLILSMANGNCPCNHDEIDQRIFKLRAMIEQAQVQFDECLFDCANETVKKACKLFDRICVGC